MEPTEYQFTSTDISTLATACGMTTSDVADVVHQSDTSSRAVNTRIMLLKLLTLVAQS